MDRVVRWRRRQTEKRLFGRFEGKDVHGSQDGVCSDGFFLRIKPPGPALTDTTASFILVLGSLLDHIWTPLDPWRTPAGPLEDPCWTPLDPWRTPLEPWRTPGGFLLDPSGPPLDPWRTPLDPWRTPGGPLDPDAAGAADPPQLVQFLAFL
ncbi:uncharacterized protein V6R79_003970 [Siganus canaliculatus]